MKSSSGVHCIGFISFDLFLPEVVGTDTLQLIEYQCGNPYVEVDHEICEMSPRDENDLQVYSEDLNTGQKF